MFTILTQISFAQCRYVNLTVACDSYSDIKLYTAGNFQQEGVMALRKKQSTLYQKPDLLMKHPHVKMWMLPAISMLKHFTAVPWIYIKYCYIWFYYLCYRRFRFFERDYVKNLIYIKSYIFHY